MVFLKKWINKPIDNITRAAAIIAVLSVVSRALGVLRDHILAGHFGAGSDLDIYFAAFRIPDFIYSLVVMGALSAGFIPIFSSLIKKNEKNKDNLKELNELVINVFNALLILIFGLSIIGIIFAAPLTKLLTPGFTEANQAQTALLTRIMFLSPLFLGMSGVLGGILQSYKRFFIYSLAPIFYNLGIIFGAVYLTQFFGLAGLAWGVVLGAFLHFFIQLPAVWHLGFRYSWRLNWRDKSLQQIAKMMGPRTMSLAVSQINLVAMTVLASGLVAGSLAIFNLANNLQSFALGVFGISFAVAAFPFLSENAYNLEALKSRFSSTLRQILFFIIPTSVLLLTLRAQIIRIVYGSGNFNWRDTILTMDTLGFFVLSLFAQASIPLLVRVFYARRDSWRPFYLGMISVVVNVILAFILRPHLGVAGLALAFSIASILNFLLLWLVLYQQIGSLDLTKILKSVIKFSASAIAAGAMVQVLKLAIWPFIDMTTFWGVFIQLVVAGTGGAFTYLFFCYLLKSEELDSAMKVLTRRLPWKKAKINSQDEARGL